MIDFCLRLSFKVDLCLLEFFSRMYTYPFFIFAVVFGHFTTASQLSDPAVVFRFFCFVFTTFLASTSVFVFVVFNIPPTKRYLYDLLGADYVRSKIGNPGARVLVKYVAPLVGLYVVDETSKYVNTLERNQSAKEALDNKMKVANEAPYLNDKQRSNIAMNSVKEYDNAMKEPVMGSVERHVSWDNAQESKNRLFDTAQKWIGKK